MKSVKLAPRFRKEQLAKVWDEHTESGAHVTKQLDLVKRLHENG